MKNNLLTSARRFRILLSLTAMLMLLWPESHLFGQSSRGRSWASPPFDSVMVASGNFAEPRPGHFHSGLDLKTGGQPGWPVYAAAEGYVSRIKVRSSGFGKALYIDHPGNITTVYAHLYAFTGPVADTVSYIQSKELEFELDIFPDKEQFRIEKGQLIGYSGNSGSSYGPHLHYEFRNTITQRPFDPILMGMAVSDSIAPELTSLVIYTPGEFGGLFGAERVVIRAVDGIYPDTVETDQQSVFLGYSVYERADLSSNPLGLKSALVLNEDDTIFYCSVDSFSYSETRFVNSLSDPLLGDTLNSFIYIAAKLPGNELSQVTAADDGLIYLHDGQPARIKIILTDRADNQSVSEFILKYNINNESLGLCFADEGIKVQRKRRLRKREGDLRVEFEKNSFYEDVRLKLNCIENPQGISDLYEVGMPGQAIHKRYTVQIRSSYSDPRAGIISVNGTDTTWFSTKRVRNMHTSTLRSFGRFTLAVDSIAPRVTNDELHMQTDSVINARSITLKLTDDLSGVSKVVTYLNGQRIVNEFNSYRNETVVYPGPLEADKPVSLKVEVTDAAGNTGEYTFIVKRNL